MYRITEPRYIIDGRRVRLAWGAQAELLASEEKVASEAGVSWGFQLLSGSFQILGSLLGALIFGNSQLIERTRHGRGILPVPGVFHKTCIWCEKSRGRWCLRQVTGRISASAICQ